MNGELVVTIVGGVLFGVFYLGIWMALLMGIRAVIRKLGKYTPSKDVPAGIWLLGSFLATGVAFGQMGKETGGAMGVVAANFLLLLTIVIAVILLVRAVVRTLSHRKSQNQDQTANPAMAGVSQLPPDQLS